ncbi:hypothetical protein BOTBODRAFT_148338 [Botryobasidium botryosum FD-172 SS1]|uniref:Tim44-like domain-containing protein n=1 Tax=Botryobasidium botryosum (strain FD-172 SS1) TaxID=930990 RepID=A0A067M039_BOTB1|nr:hypothetical protein BOTBODRAFT_148338 [Botryobasidium botryosum FD-172 SS1]
MSVSLLPSRHLLARRLLSAPSPLLAAHGVRHRTAVITKKGAPKGGIPATEEEQLAEQVRVQEIMERMPKPMGYEILSQHVPLLDHHVPIRFGQLSKWNIPTIYRWAYGNAKNWVFNAYNLFQLAQLQAIPGYERKRPPSRFSPQIFGTSSTRKHAWLASFIQDANETLIKLNQAQAQGNSRIVASITANPFQKVARQRVHWRRDVNPIWKWYGELDATRCVSIRLMSGIDPSLPKNRDAYAQILVRFNTLQSLTYYPKYGKLNRDPEKPGRCVEYLVFEKKLWQDGPWLIRDEVFERQP